MIGDEVEPNVPAEAASDVDAEVGAMPAEATWRRKDEMRAKKVRYV